MRHSPALAWSYLLASSARYRTDAALVAASAPVGLVPCAVYAGFLWRRPSPFAVVPESFAELTKGLEVLSFFLSITTRPTLRIICTCIHSQLSPCAAIVRLM